MDQNKEVEDQFFRTPTLLYRVTDNLVLFKSLERKYRDARWLPSSVPREIFLDLQKAGNVFTPLSSDDPIVIATLLREL